MNKILDYINSCVNFYGIVPKEKVLEIYNMQNKDQISVEYIDNLISNHDFLNEELVGMKKGCFVYLSIIAVNTFDEDLKMKENKPWYIPEKEELLKYIDSEYFEYNKEFEDVFVFLKKKYFFMNSAYKKSMYYSTYV